VARMRDVARRAGVSVATVSYVVNNSRRTLPETRERVLRAVRELGYVHNAAARHLAVGRSSLAGLVVPDIANPFFPELALGFQDEALLHDVDTVVMNTNHDAQRSRACVNRLLALRVCGAAVASSLSPDLDSNVAALLGRNNVPAVYFDLGRTDRWASDIVIDFGRGIGEALDHLRELGHLRIGFIAGSPQVRSLERRMRDFSEGAARRGLRSRTVVSDETVQGGYFAASKLLGDFAPTAVVAANDLMAIGAMHLAHDRGVAIPGGLSVIGIDDISLAQYMNPALTSIAVPRKRLGAAAFQAIWRLASGEACSGAKYVVETSLVVRRSSGPGG